MQGQYGKPGFGQPGFGQQPLASTTTQPSPLAQPANPYAQPANPYAQPANPYAQPMSQPPSQPAQPPPSFGPMGAYGYGHQPPPPSAPPSPSAWGQPHAGQPSASSPSPLAGFGHMGMPSLNVPNLGVKPSGLPAPLAFGMGIVAVAVALVFDVVFLHVHIPGVGAYAWYLTTALSFMGAGYGAANWTRASKTVAMTAVGIAGVIYGVADLGLGLVLESLTLPGAIMLGAQGVAIAFITGFGGVYKGLRAKYEE